MYVREIILLACFLVTVTTLENSIFQTNGLHSWYDWSIENLNPDLGRPHPRPILNFNQALVKFLAPKKRRRYPCQLHEIWLNSTSEVDPHGLNLYRLTYCDGDCNYPFPVNSTEHSRIRGKMREHGRTAVPAPCCAAVKYSEVNVTYLTNDSPQKFYLFFNASAEECACL